MFNILKATSQNDNKSALDNLRNIVAEELSAVDKKIYNLVKSTVSLIPQISEHTISSGGKRLRPILTLACAKMCEYKGNAHIDLATSVEFIHTATLLHDDVVDKSDMRRGSYTANNLWGNKESILVGDFLLGKAFELMGAASSVEVYKVLSEAAVIISEGEVKQLSLTGKLNISENDYFDVIKSKTAKLFSAACEISGVISDVKEEEKIALREYGMNLGMAFQIIDDLLDYSTQTAKLGKNIGSDFKENKITLPIILAYKSANKPERLFWEKTFSKNRSNTKEDFKIALNILESGNFLKETMNIASNIINKAEQNISIFKDSIIKNTLLNLLPFVINRKY